MALEIAKAFSTSIDTSKSCWIYEEEDEEDDHCNHQDYRLGSCIAISVSLLVTEEREREREDSVNRCGIDRER